MFFSLLDSGVFAIGSNEFRSGLTEYQTSLFSLVFFDAASKNSSIVLPPWYRLKISVKSGQMSVSMALSLSSPTWSWTLSLENLGVMLFMIQTCSGSSILSSLVSSFLNPPSFEASCLLPLGVLTEKSSVSQIPPRIDRLKGLFEGIFIKTVQPNRTMLK